MSVRLWDAASSSELRRFKNRIGWVNSAAFSPDGRQVVTAGADGSIRWWDVETGRCVLTVYSFDDDSLEPGWLAVDAEGRYRGNAAGIAHLTYIDPDEHGLMPTHWHAEDLPNMRAPDPEPPAA